MELSGSKGAEQRGGEGRGGGGGEEQGVGKCEESDFTNRAGSRVALNRIKMSVSALGDLTAPGGGVTCSVGRGWMSTMEGSQCVWKLICES